MVFSGTDELKLAQSFPGMRLDVMVGGWGKGGPGERVCDSEADRGNGLLKTVMMEAGDLTELEVGLQICFEGSE